MISGIVMVDMYYVLSNSESDESQILCNNEETDCRMFLHAKDATVNGSDSIMIVFSDVISVCSVRS